MSQKLDAAGYRICDLSLTRPLTREEIDASMLHLTFVYFPEDDDQPVVITEAQSPVIPRIGDSVLIDEADATQKGMPLAWEVIDVFFQLPKLGTVGTITEVTVYIDPSEDDEEEDED